MANLAPDQGFMHDKIIARHTCFGGHMDVNSHLCQITKFKMCDDLKWTTNTCDTIYTHFQGITYNIYGFGRLLLYFLPVHPYFYPSIFVFTRPNDGWTGGHKEINSLATKEHNRTDDRWSWWGTMKVMITYSCSSDTASEGDDIGDDLSRFRNNRRQLGSLCFIRCRRYMINGGDAILQGSQVQVGSLSLCRLLINQVYALVHYAYQPWYVWWDFNLFNRNQF